LDPYTDIAILLVEDVSKDKLILLSIGNSTSLKIGQQVAAVGSPFGLSEPMTEGIVSGLGRTILSHQQRLHSILVMVAYLFKMMICRH
jgi:S1-C subfamily serine protease